MERSWVDRVADDLAASRAELVGLAVLVAGGIVVAVVAVGGIGGRAPGPGLAVEASTPGGAGDPAVDGVIVPTGSSSSPTAGPLVVHVTGAVAAPAVVQLPAGSRLVDAVDAAGGPRADAALDVLNLALPLTDGQRLHVPTVEEASSRPSTDPTSSAAPAPPAVLDPGTGLPATDPTSVPGVVPGGRVVDGLVDLNLATAPDLEALPGVGPVLAGRILAWREEHGAFEEVGQLRDVTGIGESRFQDLAPLVVVP